MNIIPQRYHLGVVFNAFYFPLTIPDLYKSLATKKFSLAPSLEPLPAGIRKYVGGTLAYRGRTFLTVSPERNLIGMDSDSTENLLESFSDIADLLKKDFGVDVNSDVNYVEAIADLIVATNKNPIKTIGKVTAQSFSQFDRVMGCKTAHRLLSIAPKNSSPNSRDWFEIQISPRLSQPNRQYYLNIVFRNQRFSVVNGFLKEINEKVLSLIKVIESEKNE